MLQHSVAVVGMETRDGTANVQSSSTVMMPAPVSGTGEGRDGSLWVRDFTRQTIAIVFTTTIVIAGFTTRAGGGTRLATDLRRSSQVRTERMAVPYRVHLRKSATEMSSI